MSDTGTLLRDARQERGLSIEDVSHATRIKPQFLEALEHGDYSLLPGQAYVTGFLRNYAAHVGLHPGDVLQDYHAEKPFQQPTVKPATRVLESGHYREHRSRLVWAFAVVVLLLGGGFAIQQYNAIYAHPYSPPNMTPANIGAAVPTIPSQPAIQTVRLQLRAFFKPVRVWITVDGRHVYSGLIKPGTSTPTWTAHRGIYVTTWKGQRVQAVVNGKVIGRLSTAPGLVVDEASPTGWQRVA